ncbi:hypothetical protein EJ02DRAFT_208139 [Clathrospora elynae]|uniref:Uncharacterized protein n=1 Tax=Clathrospora elynae TaxID=706981 RepID=A0A6A5SW73_9PLEO|nr:hypothetical protein EJ02DRAFT_208139 [Clathrospora elynae]
MQESLTDKSAQISERDERIAQLERQLQIRVVESNPTNQDGPRRHRTLPSHGTSSDNPFAKTANQCQMNTYDYSSSEEHAHYELHRTFAITNPSTKENPAYTITEPGNLPRLESRLSNSTSTLPRQPNGTYYARRKRLPQKLPAQNTPNKPSLRRRIFDAF